MIAEGFKPGSPLFDRQGKKVRDERVARTMADAELKYREPFIEHGMSLNQRNEERANTRAEHAGMKYYRENGVEIAAATIPARVMKTFEQVSKDMGANIKDRNSVEFRKSEYPKGEIEYIMFFNFERASGDEWLCNRVSCGPDGKIGPVTMYPVRLRRDL